LRTGGASFSQPVSLVSRGKVTLKGRDDFFGLHFDSENTKSHPGPANAIRDLQIRGMGIAVGDYAEMHISGSTITGGRGAKVGVSTDYYDTVSIKRTTISGFETGVEASRSDVEILESKIRRNEIGVDNFYGGSDIRSSTITGNSKIGVRAGYYGDANIRVSTIAENGGVGVYGDVELYGSTVTGNDGAAEGYYGDTATFENSIVIGNDRDGGGPECFGVGTYLPSSDGGNVFGTGSNCGTDAKPTDAGVGDARLGQLEDNGGPTPTVALKKGSPAIGQAIPETASKRDQRGVKRGKDPDSGAFERRPFRR
jgi:hypothetical protein